MISVELTRVTDAKVRPVDPTLTDKSLVVMPTLKSRPVTVMFGPNALGAIVVELAIVLAGAGTPMLTALLADIGASPKAEVLAWTVTVPESAVPER